MAKKPRLPKKVPTYNMAEIEPSMDTDSFVLLGSIGVTPTSNRGKYNELQGPIAQLVRAEDS